MRKVVVLLSGGMDSSTLLYEAKAQGLQPLPLAIMYGQRHALELRAANEIAESAGLELRLVNLTMLRDVLAGSSQTSPEMSVPEGHYADETMKQTVVPNRNMILLSIAIGYAISRGADSVWYAAHSGDHAIYPDCRQEFVDSMRAAALLCDYSQIKIEAPFCGISKADIVKVGMTHGVPFKLTYSCYNGREKHCGRCGTCTERREAFTLAGEFDPTEYELETQQGEMR